MISHEALQYVGALAQAANAVQVINDPRFHHGTFIRVGSELRFEQFPAPLRCVNIIDMESLTDAVNDPKICPNPEVYIDAERIIVFTDRDERKSTMSLDLTPSARLVTVRSLRGRVLSQKDAIRMLRYDLEGPNSKELIPAMRSIDFSRLTANRRTVERGKDTMGRTVEAQVQQIDKVPESFSLTIPVFDVAGIRSITMTLRIGIEPDLDREGFEFVLYPDEMSTGMSAALSEVHQIIRANVAEQVPVLMGRSGAQPIAAPAK